MTGRLWPVWATNLSWRDQRPGPPGAYRRRLRLRVLAVLIVLLGGVSGWYAGHLAAPGLDRLEIFIVDPHITRPQRPALPPDPFPTPQR
jgi:hypothetical protein